jgi:hypothetical protein
MEHSTALYVQLMYVQFHGSRGLTIYTIQKNAIYSFARFMASTTTASLNKHPNGMGLSWNSQRLLNEYI